MDIRLVCVVFIVMCCSLPSSRGVHETGLVLSERNGTDNRKPALIGCKKDALKVKEEQPANEFVVKVVAVDPDVHDTIEYSMVNSFSERTRFRIDPKTGDIYTSYTFDRDEPIREKEVSSYMVWLNHISIIT